MQIFLLFSMHWINMYKHWNYSLQTESFKTVPVLIKQTQGAVYFSSIDRLSCMCLAEFKLCLLLKFRMMNALIGSQGEGPVKNLQGKETLGLSEGLQSRCACLSLCYL